MLCQPILSTGAASFRFRPPPALWRAAPPARRVTSRANNVSGVYLSRKIGVTIQCESHTVELWAIYLLTLLKKVPLRTDAETLVVKHWLSF
jgi:hypothetical protein